VLGSEEEGIQNGEPLCGQLLFARRLMYLRHRQSLIRARGSFRNAGPGQPCHARHYELRVAGADVSKCAVHGRDHGRSNSLGFGIRLQDATLRPDCNARDRPSRSFEPSEVRAADSQGAP
jgi:hypothetical protein